MSIFGDSIDWFAKYERDAVEWEASNKRAHEEASRAMALASKLADALERERERYHALAQSLVPKAAEPVEPTPDINDTPISWVHRSFEMKMHSAVMDAINRVSSGDERLRAHLWTWVGLPEQRERMQTPTGLAGVVDEIVRGKQRSA